MNATEFQLLLITWQFFGTLTWRSSRLGGCKSRERDLWTFLADFTRFRSLGRFSSLPLVVRWERGEIGERPHAHFLLAGLVEQFVTRTASFQANHEWNKRHGFAQVRPVHGSSSDRAAYLTKARDFEARDRYEFRKFDRADRVCINDAAWRLMCLGSGIAYKRQHLVA